MSRFSSPTYTWDPGIEFRLSGFHSKCFYPLSHLTAFFFFKCVCAPYVQYLKRPEEENWSSRWLEISLCELTTESVSSGRATSALSHCIIFAAPPFYFWLCICVCGCMWVCACVCSALETRSGFWIPWGRHYQAVVSLLMEALGTELWSCAKAASAC